MIVSNGVMPRAGPLRLAASLGIPLASQSAVGDGVLLSLNTLHCSESTVQCRSTAPSLSLSLFSLLSLCSLALSEHLLPQSSVLGALVWPCLVFSASAYVLPSYLFQAGNPSSLAEWILLRHWPVSPAQASFWPGSSCGQSWTLSAAATSSSSC